MKQAIIGGMVAGLVILGGITAIAEDRSTVQIPTVEECVIPAGRYPKGITKGEDVGERLRLCAEYHPNMPNPLTLLTPEPAPRIIDKGESEPSDRQQPTTKPWYEATHPPVEPWHEATVPVFDPGSMRPEPDDGNPFTNEQPGEQRCNGINNPFTCTLP